MLLPKKKRKKVSQRVLLLTKEYTFQKANILLLNDSLFFKMYLSGSITKDLTVGSVHYKTINWYKMESKITTLFH